MLNRYNYNRKKMIYKLKFVIRIFLLVFIGCSQGALIKADLKNPDVKNYLSNHYMGELGSLPIDFKINSVSFKKETVYVSGCVFDKQTKEPFPINIWVGKFVFKKSITGYEYTELKKRKYLLKTKTDGMFYVKFKIHKDDVLFADEIGYYPGVFNIYKYLIDVKILN